MYATTHPSTLYESTMHTTFTPNPHPELSREWIEHEDAYFRHLHATGAMADLMHLIARADHQDHNQQPKGNH